MTVTRADIAYVRAHVGSGPSDPDISTAIHDTGSPLAAAAHLVRSRVTEMLGQAAKTSIDGEYAEDWSANLTQLRAAAERLEQQAADAAAAADGPGGIGARRVRRPGVR